MMIDEVATISIKIEMKKHNCKIISTFQVKIPRGVGFEL